MQYANTLLDSVPSINNTLPTISSFISETAEEVDTLIPASPSCPIERQVLTIKGYRWRKQQGCLAPPTDKNKDPILGLDRFQKLYGVSQAHLFLSESYRRF